MFEISLSEYHFVKYCIDCASSKIFNKSSINILLNLNTFSNNRYLTASINWGSLGSVTCREAEDFSELLNEAADIAHTIDTMQFKITNWDEDAQYMRFLERKASRFTDAILACDDFEIESIITDAREEYEQR